MLCFEIFNHVVVPHVANIHSSLVSNVGPRLLLTRSMLYHIRASLSIHSQLKIMTKVKAITHVLLDFLFDGIDHFLFDGRQIFFNWNKFDFLKLKDD